MQKTILRLISCIFVITFDLNRSCGCGTSVRPLVVEFEEQLEGEVEDGTAVNDPLVIPSKSKPIDICIANEVAPRLYLQLL